MDWKRLKKLEQGILCIKIKFSFFSQKIYFDIRFYVVRAVFYVAGDKNLCI